MIDTALKLTLFLLPLSYSPGPGNMFFAALAGRFGIIKAIPSILAFHLVSCLIVIIIGMGINPISVHFPVFLTVVKYLGSFYILYLAWKLTRADVLRGQSHARPADFIDGAILCALNAKLYPVVILIFTQFTFPAQSISWASILWIDAIFIFHSLLSTLLWIFLAQGLIITFQNKTHVKYLNRFFGLMLMGVALWVFLS